MDAERFVPLAQAFEGRREAAVDLERVYMGRDGQQRPREQPVGGAHFQDDVARLNVGKPDDGVERAAIHEVVLTVPSRRRRARGRRVRSIGGGRGAHNSGRPNARRALAVVCSARMRPSSPRCSATSAAVSTTRCGRLDVPR